MDNQWQAIKARKTRHFGRETQRLQNPTRFGDVDGEIVEKAKVAVLVDVLPKLKCFHRKLFDVESALLSPLQRLSSLCRPPFIHFEN